jgi:hypothetical protein
MNNIVPKPVRRILSLFIIVATGAFAYNTMRVHTMQEVIILKQYGDALLKYDRQLGPFEITSERKVALRGDVKWTYYRVRNVRRSKDQRTTTLVADQIIRKDPPGLVTFWGAEKIVNRMNMVLVSPKSSWRVERYSDSFYHSGMKK